MTRGEFVSNEPQEDPLEWGPRLELLFEGLKGLKPRSRFIAVFAGTNLMPCSPLG